MLTSRGSWDPRGDAAREIRWLPAALHGGPALPPGHLAREQVAEQQAGGLGVALFEPLTPYGGAAPADTPFMTPLPGMGFEAGHSRRGGRLETKRLDLHPRLAKWTRLVQFGPRSPLTCADASGRIRTDLLRGLRRQRIRQRLPSLASASGSGRGRPSRFPVSLLWLSSDTATDTRSYRSRRPGVQIQRRGRLGDGRWQSDDAGERSVGLQRVPRSTQEERSGHQRLR